MDDKPRGAIGDYVIVRIIVSYASRGAGTGFKPSRHVASANHEHRNPSRVTFQLAAQCATKAAVYLVTMTKPRLFIIWKDRCSPAPSCFVGTWLLMIKLFSFDFLKSIRALFFEFFGTGIPLISFIGNHGMILA